MTVVDCVVAPFDQRYEKPPGAESVTFPPAQKVVGPEAVMVGVAGSGLTVTAVGAEVAEQPEASVTVTVKLPELLTVIDCVVAPLDQRNDAPALAVSVTLPPAQKVVGPDGVIVATAAAMGTTREPVTVPHECVTVRPRVTLPLAPASKVMVSVVVEEVMVPPVIVHAYAAPLTSGAEAMWPVVFGQTVGGAVIAAETAVIGIVEELLADEQELVTVRLSCTLPDGPAVKVTVFVLAPPVMVPPAMVQA